APATAHDTLSLHDALPIYEGDSRPAAPARRASPAIPGGACNGQRGGTMIRTVSAAFGRLFFVRLFSVALFAIFIAECTFPSSEASESDELKPRQAMFVGLDVSGSFKRDYDDAVAFLAHYLYGHLK